MASKNTIAVLLAVATSLAAVSARAQLIGADELLRRLEKQITGTQPQPASKPAELLADIRRFRADSPAMEPAIAAAAWLALFDRAASLGQPAREPDSAIMDSDINGIVGVHSVLAALPAPDAWPALREAARSRAKKKSDARSLGLRLLTEFLAGEHKAATATLAEIEAAAAAFAPAEREGVRAQAGFMRAELARLYGSREEVATTFVTSLDLQRRGYGGVPMPDLVGLVGEARAATILRDALVRPVQFKVPEGDATRALAKRIALEEIASLRIAQWGLVDGIDAAKLYEALEGRFIGKRADGPRGEERFDPSKRDADTYYFLHLVIEGRHADAERVLRTIAGDGTLYLPKPAVDALERAGKNEALFGFMHALLRRHPDLRVWDLYTKQAAYTGHSAEALALVESLLARKDLPDYVIADLRFQRVNALLAADKVEPAIAALRGLLTSPPRSDERNLQARAETAVRVAGLGRVLGQRDLASSGLAFAQAVLAIPSDGERNWQRDELLKSTLAELRKQGREPEAQRLAIAELERVTGAQDELQQQLGLGGGGPERAALIELAGLYGAAQRHKDVVVLLDRSAKWGAADLRAIAAEKDSLGVPIGLTAGRALAATGSSGAALGLARALVDALPGYDGGYELLVDLDKEAHAYLNGVYLRDRYEERPLIWMAVALHRRGRDVEAEALIRQAIVIDPSDGEEGPNDRMRAYAVLGDILEKKGEKAPAALFRRAVSAIRISERTDELHRLGLHERAFAGYREALGQFADAYCIQSRLALRLHEQGRRQEAYEHYRRAYELMPSSFGRVESHCFGCESVFAGPAQQGIAEKVFNDLLAKDPNKPQLHYLLGYLQKERGVYGDALKRFRTSVELDPEYLNAWKNLQELSSHVYIEARERDAARLKLLQLDPQQRHVRYELDSVGDLAELWRAVAAANAGYKAPASAPLYPLRRSAAAAEANVAKLPEAMRAQIEQYRALMSASQATRGLPQPYQALGAHNLVKAASRVMGGREIGDRE